MLYYPHYTPSKVRLRSLLLFSDTVSLIVPAIDQPGVQRREHVEEILARDKNLIALKDPTFRYSGWMEEDGVAQLTENLILKLVEKTNQKGDLAPIESDQQGYVRAGQEEKIAERWSSKRWKYVAEEKFPPDFQDLFFRDGMALRVGHFRNPVTNEIVEHNGVLCQPELADFVLSRMARNASLVEGIPSITFGGVDYVNHLFDDAQPMHADRFKLLQSAMDLLVPDNTGRCNIHDFMTMREEYQDVRRHVWRYLEDVSNDMNLELQVPDQEKLINRLEDARDHIATELETVKRQIGRKRFTSGVLFAFEAAATIGLAALGAQLGGPLGAAGTAGVGITVSRGVKKMSTLGKKPDGTAKSIAMSIAKLEKRGAPNRRAVPNYWL